MEAYRDFSDEELIRCLRNGDGRIEDYLLEKYKPLVRKKSRALFLAGGDQEDLLQEGMLGLFKAIREYTDDREASFWSFANLCIGRQMYTAIESAGRKKHGPLNSSVSFEDLEQSGDGHVIPSVESPETILLEKESYEQMIAGLQKMLSPLERQVMDLYLEGMNYRQVAEVLGKTPKSIDNALHRIRRKTSEYIK